MSHQFPHAPQQVRAYSSRSILCDPRREDMRDRINERVKLREPFRPFVPAVTHVDGTGRPQTVTADAHPLYHRLIRAFEEETDVPMVQNTSFNENEPIVHRPEEAVDCFLRTDMDVLALGPWVVRKERAGTATGGGDLHGARPGGGPPSRGRARGGGGGPSGG